MRIIKWTLITCAIVVVAGTVGMFALAASARRPSNLGATGDRLAPCPNSPNCVSTQASDPQHSMQPLVFSCDVQDAMQAIEQVMANMPRAHIVTIDDGYLHAEFTSRLFRFVDDVEFLVIPGTQTINFRAASRVGYSDLGANRRRMESIRQALVEKLAAK